MWVALGSTDFKGSTKWTNRRFMFFTKEVSVSKSSRITFERVVSVADMVKASGWCWL